MSNDPRRTTTSSSHADHSALQNDIDWLDFLRTAGGTVPTDPRPQPQDRSSSWERKRRHTGSEPERRDYPYPNHNGRSADPRLRGEGSSSGRRDGSGNSLETAIDLTMSPPRLYRPSTDRSVRRDYDEPGPQRRESDIVLPKWQPDHEVSKCPVCSNEFSFWYRKHHCRKCGRVVCANCSPHRITIPRQYIVQPPNPNFEDEANPSAISPMANRSNPALGGGEVVRVCNPCVPDPWTPETASPAAGPISVPPPPATSSSINTEGPARPNPRDPRWMDNRDQDRPDRYRYVAPSGQIRNRSFTHQIAPSYNRRPSHIAAGMPASFGGTSHDGLQHRVVSRYGHRYSQSGADRSGATAAPRHSGMPQPSSSSTSAPNAPVTKPPIQPRREVKEEDECPVCGTEMALGDSVREAHIQACIASRFSSTPSGSSRPLPAPAENQDVGSTSTSAASSGTPPQGPMEASRPRATSYRPRGMAIYRATEKDCLGADGEPQECVICFEEFEPGDEMGRMECLCKFHRLCIRQWWSTKGQGSCPTHQLHD